MYDWKQTAIRAGKALGYGAGSVAIAAVFGWAASTPGVTDALHKAGMSDVLVLALVPLVNAAGRAAENWWKHRNLEPAQTTDTSGAGDR